MTDAAFGGCTALKEVYFGGDEAAWEVFREENVGMESAELEANAYGNTYLFAASVYFYSEEPNTDGNHWHYGEDGKPILWE